jgi:LacI family transcriptional regulator, repressor for deo operon, udp, cdd, tsx, nupC, and nupG
MSSTSITDIARAAGVSPSTVSRALQDHPRISAQKRAIIRALAQEMGYQPSQVARSLVTGRTKTLGIVITDVADPFVAEVMKGAEQAGREVGYSLLFATSRRDPGQELLAARLLLGRQVDGMIVISSRAAGHYARLLGVKGFPLILVNHELNDPHAHSVRTDNREGIRQAVFHLRELGHSRIAFVAGPDGGKSSRERLEAFCQVRASMGLPDLPGWVIEGKGLLEDGARAFRALSDMQQRPTAVLCYNDLTAIGLMAAAHEAGVRIPERISVIGYDNIALSGFTVPPLTTIDQPEEAMGRTAVENCVRALAGEEVADVILPGALVIRKSTTRCAPEERGW